MAKPHAHRNSALFYIPLLPSAVGLVPPWYPSVEESEHGAVYMEGGLPVSGWSHVEGHGKRRGPGIKVSPSLSILAPFLVLWNDCGSVHFVPSWTTQVYIVPLFHCSWSALLDPSWAIISKQLLTHLPVLLPILQYIHPHLPTPIYSFILSSHPSASITICSSMLSVYLSTCVCIYLSVSSIHSPSIQQSSSPTSLAPSHSNISTHLYLSTHTVSLLFFLCLPNHLSTYLFSIYCLPLHLYKHRHH